METLFRYGYAMTTMLGFWSYVHADDEAAFDLISALARDIARTYESIRNEPIDLFLDRDDLAWGDRWREKIDKTLSNVAFFVPVLTPRYFASIECRREYQFFLERSKALGIPALVLPLLYESVPGLEEESSSDELIETTKASNWRDWRELRFEDRSSAAYRRGVHDLASEIARRAEQVEATDVVRVAEAAAASGDALEDDSPGFMDLVGELEIATPRWGETLTEITEQIKHIGEIMQAANSDVTESNSQGKGFAARLVIARRVAAELEPPVDAIESLVTQWLNDLDVIDQGVRALVRQIKVDPTVDESTIEGFIATMRELSVSARDNLTKSMTMADALDLIGAQSRDLRPVVRRLRAALVALNGATKVTDDWAAL
jgi:hypothetical protein